MRTVLQFADAETCGRAAAAHIGRAARRALSRAPLFSLALSGGRSPIPLFRSLAAPSFFPSRLWERTHIFLADERMVPPDHPDSNFGSIRTHLLLHVPIPKDNIHPVRTDLPPNLAAQDYEAELARHCGGTAPPTLDLAVLGMGADGHTASIFPGIPLPAAHPWVAPVPRPGAIPDQPRLTLTTEALNAAREIVFMILGTDKHPALAGILAGGSGLPAARIDVRPQSWYVCPPLPPNFQPPHGRSHGRI